MSRWKGKYYTEQANILTFRQRPEMCLNFEIKQTVTIPTGIQKSSVGGRLEKRSLKRVLEESSQHKRRHQTSELNLLYLNVESLQSSHIPL